MEQRETMPAEEFWSECIAFAEIAGTLTPEDIEQLKRDLNQ